MQFLPLFCPWSVLMLWMPQLETPAVNTVSTFPHFPLVPDLQHRIKQNISDNPLWFQMHFRPQTNSSACVYVSLMSCLPILFRSRSSFLLPSLCSTASSSCGHLYPSGSRASRTSITTSDASITWQGREGDQVKDQLFFLLNNTDWGLGTLPCLIQSRDTVWSSCVGLSFSPNGF